MGYCLIYMKHLFLLTLSFIIFTSLLSAQTLKGKITSQNGEPIQYSTVFIKELRQGTTTNTKGDYEINLPAGTYTIVYQSLGYQPITTTVTITNDTIKNIILPLQYYEIPEVRISGSGEDPAYMIMRKAIGLAPYYLNNVSYYKAEVYLKGNLIINKIPRLLQKSMKMETTSNGASVSAGSKPKKEEKTLKAGDSFFMESVNEIEFNSPDKYFQRMISYNSTFPAQGNSVSPMSFIQASFYQPVLAEIAISPLAPNAFSHYNYKYLGTSRQGDFTINKIQVIPKRKSQQVFEGTIYIIEDLWCLQSVDLTNDNLIGKIRIEQLFIPVQDDIWMPVSHQFYINIGIIGFKADVSYGSSVKYKEVKPNLNLQKPAALISDYSRPATKKTADTIISKQEKQINKILEKDQLTNRDMAKLAKLMEKESAKSDTGKKSLEIKDNVTRKVEKDAGKYDSTYWAKIRPIPLSDIERKTVHLSDSIKSTIIRQDTISDTIPGTTNRYSKKSGRKLKNIVLGHTWSDSAFMFRYDGLINLKSFNFNSVDGFSYGWNFDARKSWKFGTLEVIPDVRWPFSRERLIWNVNTSFSFDKIRHRSVYFRVGTASKDINNMSGINPFMNIDYSLLFKKNYLKLYESSYINAGYSSEIVNGLKINVSGNFENRKVLRNNTNFSIFRSSKLYSPNVPINPYLEPGSNEINALRNQKHFDIAAEITYIPYQKYKMIRGVKFPEGSDWPTFNLAWIHGRNEFSEISSGWRTTDMLRFEVSRTRTVGAFSEFKWRLRTAGYLDNRTLTFYDFFHINSQPLPILLNNYEDAFMIPSFYSLSTAEFYVEAHIKYTTPYLLLKLLPVMSNTLMRENISFSYLGRKNTVNYSEIGYSISEILLIGELGVYAGFEDLRYKSVGLKLIFKLN
jgi:hypothetical protein